MPNLQLRHPLAGAILLIATSWALHALAADSEAPKPASSEPATISDPAPTAVSGASPAPATTAAPKNSQAVANSAPHVAHVRRLSHARAAAPNVPAPKALASSRKAIRSAPRSASVKLAATYDGRATRCSVCVGSLILGIAY
jgi:hypothetical protein